MIWLGIAIDAQVLMHVPRSADHQWPPKLFADTERQLKALLRGQYMPKFMDHSVFSHVLTLLGSYDAELLFPATNLETAKRDLTLSMEGELTGTLSALDMSV